MVNEAPLIVGGRYGLASKDTTLTQILSVYEKLVFAWPRTTLLSVLSMMSLTASLPPKEELHWAAKVSSS